MLSSFRVDSELYNSSVILHDMMLHASCISEVSNVEIDMEGQKVLVTSTLSSDEVLAKIY